MREKQIEKIKSILCSNEVDERYCSTHCRLGVNSYCLRVEVMAKDIYNASYRKQSEGEWISVDERLPNKEDLERSQFHSFLVTNEFGEVREAVFTGKYFAKLGSRLSGVTHWMPLPEPPKMKDGTK